MPNEIELTPFLEQLLVNDINARNKAQNDFDLHIKMIFESKGLDMPQEAFNVKVENGKLIVS